MESSPARGFRGRGPAPAAARSHSRCRQLPLTLRHVPGPAGGPRLHRGAPRLPRRPLTSPRRALRLRAGSGRERGRLPRRAVPLRSRAAAGVTPSLRQAAPAGGSGGPSAPTEGRAPARAGPRPLSAGAGPPAPRPASASVPASSPRSSAGTTLTGPRPQPPRPGRRRERAALRRQPLTKPPPGASKARGCGDPARHAPGRASAVARALRRVGAEGCWGDPELRRAAIRAPGVPVRW